MRATHDQEFLPRENGQAMVSSFISMVICDPSKAYDRWQMKQKKNHESHNDEPSNQSTSCYGGTYFSDTWKWRDKFLGAVIIESNQQG